MPFHKKLPRKRLEDALLFITAADLILQRFERDDFLRMDDCNARLLQQIAEQCASTRLRALQTEILMHKHQTSKP